MPENTIREDLTAEIEKLEGLQNKALEDCALLVPSAEQNVVRVLRSEQISHLRDELMDLTDD